MVITRGAGFSVAWFALLLGGCAGESPGELVASGAGRGGQVATAGGSAGGGLAGVGGNLAAATGGAVSSAGAASTLGGASASGAAGTGGDGTSGGGGAAGMASTAGAAGSAGSSGGGPVIPSGCKVSTPVSFKADIQPWLATSCGKAKGSGCHVTDDASTLNSACPDGTKKCGFNHAYDWITAGAHNEFCKQTPAPIRFTVVMDVVRGANPPRCTSTRVMPPDGPPLDTCQMAALEAWLAEPQVLQLHRADDSSPSDPYLMPPFN